ncbi:Golgi-resident adenosine 3',5'-bisphosphate 3'-phosphatase-like [Carcharodon carcharias]|uniref:Golgi-resident adenosine 3',5'-bisphosphate 3'-phosphatase-like n=1 Tax=Carcharodon carcharias TaxID=13397 RepID=UPI001B7E4C3F|nr:Golgi-resident adenosine 3',5'-bisphosphate 3'-phosphatase-like [Carcharodon carcharias]
MAPIGVRVSRSRVLLCILLLSGMIYYQCSRSVRNAGSRVDLRQLLSLAIIAAEEGGKAVRAVRESDSLGQRSKGKTKEGAEELVTTGDLLSHGKMSSLFSNAFPGIKLISEEHDNSKVNKSLTWNYEIPNLIQESIGKARMVSTKSVMVWIDPLDATREYTEDLNHFVTTMVCVAVDGKPVIGVIHKPFSKYTAWAMVDGASNIHPRKAYKEKTPTVIVSRSHAGAVKSYCKGAFGNDTTIIPAGGAGYKVLSLLDTGEDTQPDSADVYIHVTFIKKWDICAGDAILKALGGQMTTIEGDAIDYSDFPSNNGGLVASIGIDHHALLKRLPDLKSLAPKM